MKTAVVTGANTGIGREIALGLARQDMRVILACRDETKAEAARASITAATGNARIEWAQVDRLDVLVNNAGVSIGSRQLTPDGIEWDLGVNLVWGLFCSRTFCSTC